MMVFYHSENVACGTLYQLLEQHTVTWYDLTYKCQKLHENFASFIKTKRVYISVLLAHLPFNMTGLSKQLN